MNLCRPLLVCFLLALVAFARPERAAAQWQEMKLPAGFESTLYLDVTMLPGDNQRVWVCGTDKVIRSTDGGNTWAGTVAPGASHLEHIQFVDQNNGWLSGSGAWRTTDGGATWRDVTPSARPEIIWGCFPYSATECVVVGGGCDLSQNFWRTTDGGNTWALFADNLSASGLTDLLLYPDNTGVAISSNRFYTTTDRGATWARGAVPPNAFWHEEIAQLGQSLSIPWAGSSCNGGGAGGGVHYSSDGGSSWNTISTGLPMFGCYVLPNGEGWGAGVSRSVIHTTDYGQTWATRNCGIPTGRNLDDVFFNDRNTGFVVGNGVYRYSPRALEVSRNLVDFGRICLPGSRADTIRIDWFGTATLNATFSLIGPDRTSFTVNPIGNVSFPGCSNRQVVITCTPDRSGDLSAQLVISGAFGTATVDLVAKAVNTDWGNSGDTLVFDPAPCGIPTTRTFRLNNNTGVTLDLVGSQAELASGTAVVQEALPLSIPQGGADIRVMALTADTGWVSGIFRLGIAPCDRIDSVVIRARGVSPIVNTVDSLRISGGCSATSRLAVPVWNTGNAELLLNDIVLRPPSTGAKIIGWRSGQPLNNRRLPVGASDTLIVEITASGAFSTRVSMVTNDRTTVRGDKAVVEVLLRSTNDRPTRLAKMSDTLRACIGSFDDKALLVIGDLLADGEIVEVSGSGVFTAAPTSVPRALRANDTVGVAVRFSPTAKGVFTGEIRVRIAPCDTIIRVPVVGIGRESDLRVVDADRVIDVGVIDVGTPTVGNTRLRAGAEYDEVAEQSVSDSVFARAGLRRLLVARGRVEQAAVDVVARDTGSFRIVVPVYSEGCGLVDSVIVVGVGRSSVIDADDARLWQFGACRTGINDKIVVANPGNESLVITSATFSGAASADFAIVSPALPWTVPPGSSLEVQVRVTPQAEGLRDAQLLLFHNDRRSAAANPHVMNLRVNHTSPLLALTSADSVDLGVLCVGSSAEFSVNVVNRAASGAAIVGVRHADDIETLANPGSIAASSEGTIRLEWRPTVPGEVVDTVYVQFERCDYEVAVVVRRRAVASLISFRPAAVEFNDIEPLTSTSASVWLHNDGIDSVLVSSLPVDASLQGVSLVPTRALPAWLAPGDSLQVEVAFAPQSEGEWSGPASPVVLQPCPASSPLNILASASFVQWSVSPGAVDTALWCTDKPLEIVVTIENTGSNPLVCDSIRAEGDIEIPAIPRPLTIARKSSYSFVLSLPRTSLGTFGGVVYIATDDTTASLPVRYEVRKAPVDLPALVEVDADGAASSEFVITTPAERLVRAVFLEPSFGDTVRVVVPPVLREGDNPVSVEFDGTRPGITRTRLAIVVGDACADTVFADIVVSNVRRLRFELDQYSAPAGAVIDVPVWVVGRMEAAEADSVVIEVAVDEPDVVEPLKFESAAGVTSSYWTSFDKFFRLVLPGSSLRAAANNDSLRQPLATVQMLVFAARNPITPLRFRSVEIFTAEKVQTTTDDGSVLVTDFCKPTVQKIMLRGLSARVRHLNGPASELTLDLLSGTSDVVSVDIVDLTGRTTRLSEGVAIGSGASVLVVPLASEIPAGAYFVRVVGKDGVTRAIPVIISR